MELSVFLTFAFLLRMDVVVGSIPPPPPPTTPEPEEWWSDVFRVDLSGTPLLQAPPDVPDGAMPGWWGRRLRHPYGSELSDESVRLSLVLSSAKVSLRPLLMELLSSKLRGIERSARAFRMATLLHDFKRTNHQKHFMFEA